MVSRDSKIHNTASSLFFVDYYIIWTAGGDLVIHFISESHRSLCFSFSRKDDRLCIYHLFVWSNLNFLLNSQWITLPTQFKNSRVLFFFRWLLLSVVAREKLEEFERLPVFLITVIRWTFIRFGVMGNVNNWEFWKRLKYVYTAKWYLHKQESILENGTLRILWDIDFQSYHLNPVRRPD